MEWVQLGAMVTSLFIALRWVRLEIRDMRDEDAMRKREIISLLKDIKEENKKYKYNAYYPSKISKIDDL